MNMKRIFALAFAVLMVLALAACGTKNNDKMDVDVTKTPNHTECIRCGMCIRACPTNAVCFRCGFGDGEKTTKKTNNMEESK